MGASLGTYSGGGLGMGIVFSLFDNFTATANKIEQKMGALDLYSEKLASKINSSMNMMAVGLGATALGFLGLAPIFKAIGVAGDFEQQQISFDVMLGSAEKAKKMLSDLMLFARQTPFNFLEVSDLTKQLLAYGVAADSVMSDMKAIGDIAAGVGRDKLPRIVLAFGQVATKTRLMGQEVRQFAEAGVPILDQLARHFGKTTAVIQDMISDGLVSFQDVRDVMYEMTREGGRFNNLMGRQMVTWKAVWSNVQDVIYQAGISIGQIFLPAVKFLVNGLYQVGLAFKAFAENPIGKVIIFIVGAFLAFITVLGISLLLMGASRFVIYKMAGAFGDLTKATILQTIAQRGAIAGFRAMAVAAWASLGPYVLIAAGIIAVVVLLKKLWEGMQSAKQGIVALSAIVLFALGPIGWLIGLVALAVRAIREFKAIGTDSSYKPRTGFMGFLEKLGGALVGFMEIWRSWNSQTGTFELSIGTEQKLAAMGMLDTVLKIASWVIRIKEFMAGVKDAFVEAFTLAKHIINSALDSLGKLLDSIGLTTVGIDAAKSSLERWRHAGKILGYVLVGVLLAIVAVLVLIGVVAAVILAEMVIAWLPVILIAWLLYEAIVYIVKAFQWLGGILDTVENAWNSFWDSAFSNVGDFFEGLLVWFALLPIRMFEAGVNMIKGFWDGIKSVWTSFTSWLENKIANMPVLGQILSFAGTSSAGLAILAGSMVGDASANDQVKTPYRNTPAYQMNEYASNKAEAATYNNNSQPVIIDKTKTEVRHITLHTQLDSDTIAKRTIDLMNLDHDRH